LLRGIGLNLLGSLLCFGALYNINPYDQPGVEASKRATYGLMGREGFAEEAEEVARLEARKLPDYVL